MACSRGVAEDLLGRTGLDDDAVLQEADGIGYLPGETHLVRGDQHRHALVSQFSDEVEHLRDQFRVERGSDLVQEQQPGVHRQRPDDGDSLLLASREAVGELGGLVRKADPAEQFPGALLGRGRVRA